jgi:hypothetical protein
MKKAYDVKEYVNRLRAKTITPHIVQNDTNRRSPSEGRTTRPTG